jgi:RNA polymerase sigma-70 factor (ECF subfamily)
VTDRELIVEYRDTGDEGAFNLLVSRHRSFIRKVLFGVFGRWDEHAEDAEQEVLIALSTTLHRFRFESSFLTFLYRLTRTKGIDQLRILKKRRSVFGSEALERENGRALTPEGIDDDDRIFLYTILGRLRESERSILLLKDIEGFTIEQIAELMNIPAGTAKSRIHRARSRAVRLAQGGCHEVQTVENNSKRA